MKTVKNALKGFLFVLCMSLGVGLGQDLKSGTEVLLTDLSSERIVGHGQVEGRTLNLNLIDTTGGFFLYFIFPDGQVATHQGELGPELIAVFTDAGDLLDFTEVLSARGGIDLNVIRAKEENLNPNEPLDDGQLSQPES